MAKVLRVLIVEDSEDDVLLLLRALRRGEYDPQYERVDTAEGMRAALLRQPWDIILSDFSMPHFDAPSALETLKSVGLDLPFIIVSGTVGEDRAVAALKAGAHDFMIKGHMPRLAPAIEREMREAASRRERRRITEALRGSEEQYRLLAEISPDAITLINLQTVIQMANPQAARLYGYANAHELMGVCLGQLVAPADRDRVLNSVSDVLAARGTPSIEYSLMRSDGTSFDAEVSSAAVTDAQGLPRGIVCVTRDISARKRAEREQAILLELSQSLLGVNEMEAVMGLAVDAVMDAFQADFGEMLSLDEHSGSLILGAGRGWFAPMPGAAAVDGGVDTLALFALTSRQTVGVKDYAAETRFGLTVRYCEHGVAAGLAAPLLAGARALGVLSVLWRKPREHRPEESRLLSLIANQIGVALEKTRLFVETGRRLARFTALRTIDTAISSSLDLRVTLNIFVGQVLSQLGVDAVAMLLYNPHSRTLNYASGRGFRTETIARTQLRIGEGHAGRAALERHVIAVSNLAEKGADPSRKSLFAVENFVSYYAVPLQAKGQTKGVLEIFHRAPLDPDAEWLDFLEMLAGQGAIAIDNAELFSGVQRSNAELMSAYDTTIEGWSRALDLRDHETEGHTRRVTEGALNLARAMGLGPEQLVHIRRGALLHDIGKMGVPDAILLKPGPLTDEERNVMSRHPQFANDLLAPIGFLRPALDVPYCHHEKWDGSGYPRGLKGEEIPLVGRIFAVVDVWDALCSNRPYRVAWPREQVRDHIRGLAGTHFDPKVVDAFMRLPFQ